MLVEPIDEDLDESLLLLDENSGEEGPRYEQLKLLGMILSRRLTSLSTVAHQKLFLTIPDLM